MKQTVSPFKKLQNGVEDSKLYRIKNQEGSMGLWGLANWTHCISGQTQHSQGCQGYISFNLLM